MASYIARRKFLATLVGGAAAWPLVSQAQEAGRTYRLGVLVPTVSRQTPPVLALLDELRRNGFVEGQNLSFSAASRSPTSSFPKRRRPWSKRRPT